LATEFSLSGQDLFLERRGEARDAVELEFLLDFLCDAAAVVETATALV